MRKAIKTNSAFFNDTELSDTEQDMKMNLKSKPSKPNPPIMHAKINQLYPDIDPKIDSQIYDYDSFLDHKDKRKKIEIQTKKQLEIVKPKYIHHLMEEANRKKKEKESRQERKLEKQREEEGDLFIDKEKFVTRAYKEYKEERDAILNQDDVPIIKVSVKEVEAKQVYKTKFNQNVTVEMLKENNDRHLEEIKQKHDQLAQEIMVKKSNDETISEARRRYLERKKKVTDDDDD